MTFAVICSTSGRHLWRPSYFSSHRHARPKYQCIFLWQPPQLVRRVKVRVWDFLLETKGCRGWGLAVGVGLHRLDREWPPGGRTHTQKDSRPDRWTHTLPILNSNTHTVKLHFLFTQSKMDHFVDYVIIIIMCTSELFHTQFKYILPYFYI